MDTTLRIDRGRPFRLAEFESMAALAPLYAVPLEDAALQRLATIDVDAIQLVALTGSPDRGASADVSQRVADKLAQLRAGGAVPLDAKALESLLAHPGGIPDHWLALVDTSSNARHPASIRFYGSRFELLETGDMHVLGLSFHGGRWSVQLERESDLGHEVHVPIVGTGHESTWASGD